MIQLYFLVLKMKIVIYISLVLWNKANNIENDDK